jgi:ElaB/YqjD/DUF883 family membrane-anchored ribosome-binding protein
MTAKKRDEELETITQEIARLRENMAALAASITSQAEVKAAAAGTGDQEATGAEQVREGWADIQRTFEEARARGEKMLNDLAAEVEQHPLRSIALAAGFGFILAKVFGRGRSR